ncbi:glycosyltransferase domain-containing protein [Xanthobacter sp. AM11]|uniref:glycosyltransferase domain-containing protein n=1 Tax=Xanthobacter sp. AM11 TaxID=3380643 RepID=UPI0039BF97CC
MSGPRPAQRACVYTCLFGGYERLNEQEVAADSALDFICFTDNPALTSRSWRMVVVEPVLPLDLPRSQRIIKLSPHAMVPDYDVSLYLDNSVILTAPPEAVIARYLGPSSLAAIPAHSFRATVADEFLEILRLGFDDGARILEQLNHYRLTEPEVLDTAPYWSAIMIRRHHHPQVIAAMELWLTHVLRYCRRDQVSAPVAFRRAGLAVERIAIDNGQSWFHRWPVALGRNRDAFPFAPGLGQLPAEMLAGEWLRRKGELEGRIAELEAALEAAQAAAARAGRDEAAAACSEGAERAIPVADPAGELPQAAPPRGAEPVDAPAPAPTSACEGFPPVEPAPVERTAGAAARGGGSGVRRALGALTGGRWRGGPARP